MCYQHQSLTNALTLQNSITHAFVPPMQIRHHHASKHSFHQCFYQARAKTLPLTLAFFSSEQETWKQIQDPEHAKVVPIQSGPASLALYVVSAPAISTRNTLTSKTVMTKREPQIILGAGPALNAEKHHHHHKQQLLQLTHAPNLPLNPPLNPPPNPPPQQIHQGARQARQQTYVLEQIARDQSAPGKSMKMILEPSVEVAPTATTKAALVLD